MTEPCSKCGALNFVYLHVSTTCHACGQQVQPKLAGWPEPRAPRHAAYFAYTKAEWYDQRGFKHADELELTVEDRQFMKVNKIGGSGL